VGNTVYYTDPVEATPVNQLESLRALCDDMAAGTVDTLLIAGGNPVYDAPHDFDFAAKLKKVRNAIHLSSHFDETAEYCQWHIPESHYLEAWGDARAFDGTLSIIQPLIAPLYNTISAYELLAAFSDKTGVTAYDSLRERLKTLHGPDFDRFWRKSLHDGVVANTTLNPITVASAATLPATNPAATDALEFIFRPDPALPTMVGCRNCPSRSPN
jgi:molybdopterin-containing oxidoreductase family iron-sulfur binding subunit